MSQQSGLTEGCLLSGYLITRCISLLRPYLQLSWDGPCHGPDPTLFLPVMTQSACHCSMNIWNCFSASLLFLYGTFGLPHRRDTRNNDISTDPTELHELLLILNRRRTKCKRKRQHLRRRFARAQRNRFPIFSQDELKFVAEAFDECCLFFLDQSHCNTNHTTHPSQKR